MNIINALPGIVPTARPSTLGKWPQKSMKMRNGKTKKWNLANLPSGDKMDLTWENITYAQAQSICGIWDLSYGIYGTVVLPPEVFGGTGAGLRQLLSGSRYLEATWHFTGPPQIESVKARRCTVRLPIGIRGYIGAGTSREFSTGGYASQTQWVSNSCPFAGHSISVKYEYTDFRAAAKLCSNPSSTRAAQITQQEVITRDPQTSGYRLCGLRILPRYTYYWTETCQSVPATLIDAGVQWLWEGNIWTAFRSAGGYGEGVQGPLTSSWETIADPNYMVYDILEIKVDGQVLEPSRLVPYPQEYA